MNRTHTLKITGRGGGGAGQFSIPMSLIGALHTVLRLTSALLSWTPWCQGVLSADECPLTMRQSMLLPHGHGGN